MKIGTHQSKNDENFVNCTITSKGFKVSSNFQFCNLSWFTNLFDFVPTTTVNVILLIHLTQKHKSIIFEFV